MTWEQIRSTRPIRLTTLSEIPRKPGIYVWFRDQEPVYIGKATNLHDRLKSHLRKTLDLSRSAFRRNVAAHLGVATVALCRVRPSILTAAQVGAVNEWVSGCKIVWVETSTPQEARAMEKALIATWKPPLNRAP